ncbi:MAG: DinB family protein [Chitinophagaceae bacterium]
MQKKYRNRFVGAMMDEYERAAAELLDVVKNINQDDFVKIMDTETTDQNCKSIQAIMNHVVKAGYGYANYIRKTFAETFIERKEDYELHTPQKACDELVKMLAYTEESLAGKWYTVFEDLEINSIKTTWGQEYDFEQMFEHAIVHILRHRRQVEKFLDK